MRKSYASRDGKFTFEEGKSYEFKYRQSCQRIIWEPFGSIDGGDWWRMEHMTPVNYYVSGYIPPHMFTQAHWESIRKEKGLKTRELSDDEVRECNKMYIRWDALWSNQKGFKNPWVKLKWKQKQ